ncbi:MAG: peptide/nickel transport system permease protein [Thermomicrobiales bacterium]|nr:peptide/nickel transport system permease protein [Thermomicrobiales bacterium]MEA2583953.1 peptide/nickel transport system permease protein [Thermomicrobiales bacterium]
MENATVLRAHPRMPQWRRSVRLTFRNRLVFVGGLLVVALTLVALFAGLVAPYDPIATNSSVALRSPSVEHPFGTDRFGRDVFSRAIHGSRISLWVSLASVAVATTVGTILGLASGYFGRWTDLLISRVLDILFSFPGLLLAIGIAAFLGPGQNNAILAIAIVYSPLIARVVRGSVLAERHKEYVEAARLIGARHGRILRRHVLPNVLSPIIVQASITLSYAILIEASLSYLGLGTQPPNPSWGTMLSEGRPFLERAPWMSVFPGMSIMLAVFAFNLLGDGLREMLDPRLRSG